MDNREVNGAMKRDHVLKELERIHAQKGVGSMESQQAISALSLQVLLEILDVLIQIRDQEHVVDFVPPDYGKEDKLV